MLGGTQSLHTNSMDETLALPSEKAASIALRTQQIIAYETGVANTVDPLAGSYFVEALTDKMEAEAEEVFRRDRTARRRAQLYRRRLSSSARLAKAAYRFQQELEKKERVIVGVNDFVMENEKIDIPVLRIDRSGGEGAGGVPEEDQSAARCGKVQATLENLRKVASGSGNTFEAISTARRRT